MSNASDLPSKAYSDEEAMRRARDALRRALSTPPQLRDAKPKNEKPPGLVKARASKKRATAGRPMPSD
jgi:hypothetical protein